MAIPETAGNCYHSVGDKCQPYGTYWESTATCEQTSELLDTYVNGLANLIVQSQPFMDEKEPERTTTRLKDYIEHLLVYRIMQVNREKLPIPPKEGSWIVPAFISTVLAQVGRVQDDDRFIVVTPKLSKRQEKLEKWDEAKLRTEFRWLRVELERAGIQYAKGLPKEITGDCDVMTIQVIDNAVKGERKLNNGIAAVVAGFLGMTLAEKIVYPRLTYVDLKMLKGYIAEVVDYETHA